MKQKTMSALYMGNYGIGTVVMTNHDKFDLYMDGYKSDGVDKWTDAHKKHVIKFIHDHLLMEDAYFNEHPNQVTDKNKRWAKFCDDCIELATLDQYLFGNPIILVHPDAYENISTRNQTEASFYSKPDLIQGIAAQRRDH